MRSARRFLLASVLLAPLGCSSPRESWTYALSREFYDSAHWKQPWTPPIQQGGSCEAVALVAIFLLPFLIDTAILPVTATHDLLVTR
jgi:hypothetical protein